MQVKKTLSEGLNVEFSVTVPAKQIQEMMDARLEQYGANAKVPGFRPGKIPQPVLMQRYGDQALKDVLESSIDTSTNEIVKEHDLRPAMQPKVNVTAFDHGKDLEFTLKVESLPEIKVQDFDKLKLEKLVVKLEDSDVEESVKTFAERHRRFKDLDAPRKSQKGDLITLDFTAKVDGNVWGDFSKKEIQVELGAGDFFFEKIEKELTGAEAGKSGTVENPCPEDFPIQDLAGKTLVCDFEIKTVQEGITFKADDDLAKDVGLKDFKELKEKIKESMVADFDNATKMLVKRRLLDALADSYKFDLPPTMIESEFKAIWQHLENEVKTAEEAGQKHEGKPINEDEDLKEEYQEIAKRRVLLGLLISEIARQNKVQLTEEEVRNAVYNEAMRYPGQEKEVIEYYRKNQEALNSLCSPSLEDKVVDFILSSATLKEREVDTKTFREEVDGVLPSAGEKGKPSDKKAKKKATGKSKGKAA